MADSNSEEAANKQSLQKHFIASHGQYVKLNVGGSLFLTTVDTLTKYDSMLKAMFSGRMEVRRDTDGYVLIDRCGKHFGLILNFLREGTLPLPDCRTEVLEILIEAKYYLMQELVDLCYSSLKALHHDQLVSTLGICRVPVVVSKKQVEQIVQSCAGKPVIELLMNRQNNKYSYNASSDENFLRNQELFDKLILRFNNRVLFIKNIGIGSSEICQWAFYGKTNRKIEICCTSIVYATDKKQTKVEFPEARIYEEALNVLLTFDQGELSGGAGVCTRCRGQNDDDFLVEFPAELGQTGAKRLSSAQQQENTALGGGAVGSVMCNGRIDWRLEQLALNSTLFATSSTTTTNSGTSADEGAYPGHQMRRKGAAASMAIGETTSTASAASSSTVTTTGGGGGPSSTVPMSHRGTAGQRKMSECDD
ncbi:hypothetical protein niasHS_004851 [Heterodera schachtii]|uniref:BTB domain-containing protein n=1 Tax=Heterodera schachtii TaxID=97005 RepID=A0ABD2JUZ8_HETSC